MPSFVDRLYAPRVQAIQQAVALVILAAFATALTIDAGAPPLPRLAPWRPEP